MDLPEPLEKRLRWPGRERLPYRERLLLEARTLLELIVQLGEAPAAELERLSGRLEPLRKDWEGLRAGTPATRPAPLPRRTSIEALFGWDAP